MNSKPSTSKSTTFNETKENNTASKLRRLKIEENILLQCLKKHEQKNNYEMTELDTVSDSDCKIMMKNLKDAYIKIKNLFDDIKIITNSQELLADVEIYEIKNRVMELESTMRSFKLHLAAELNLLMSAEHELTKQLEDINRGGNIKRRAKIASASFIQAVPSPVRLLMTSPLKCSEVQEFQDFMTNSPNRYGGWNEYHHNIFVKQWQKHFRNHLDSYFSDSVADKVAFENFVEESLFKLQGIDKNTLMTHIDWYKKYLYLKSKQQTAINKWKSTRKSLRRTPEANQIQNNSTNEIEINQKTKCRNVKKEITKTIQKVINNDDIERLRKPTTQWLSRCEYEQTMKPINDIESLKKLGIPIWRQYL